MITHSRLIVVAFIVDRFIFENLVELLWPKQRVRFRTMFDILHQRVSVLVEIPNACVVRIIRIGSFSEMVFSIGLLIFEFIESNKGLPDLFVIVNRTTPAKGRVIHILADVFHLAIDQAKIIIPLPYLVHLVEPHDDVVDCQHRSNDELDLRLVLSIKAVFYNLESLFQTPKVGLDSASQRFVYIVEKAFVVIFVDDYSERAY